MRKIRHKLRVLTWVIYRLSSPIIFSIPISKARYYYLQLFIKGLGKGTFIGRNVDIREPWNIYIGEHCVINKNVVLDGRGSLKISDNVDIAQEVNIWTEQHDYNDNNHSLQTAPVVIYDHVWITSRATILPGVTIGRGAVVAAGAIVTKNVDDLQVVGGVPAQPIASRKNDLAYTLNFKPKYTL